ncbi:MAG TPA: hypothetical protein VHD83_12465 [Puia sp.]|nr:hypothetical protein [Puia sp.]
MSLLQDRRLRAVQWKDLTHLSPIEMIIENSITLPWLIISCWAARIRQALPDIKLKEVF